MSGTIDPTADWHVSGPDRVPTAVDPTVAQPTTVTNPATGRVYQVNPFDPSTFDPASLAVFSGYGPAGPIILPGQGGPAQPRETPYGTLSPDEDAGAWNAAHPGHARPNSDFYTPEHRAALDTYNATDPLYNFVNSGPTLTDALLNSALLVGGSILGGGFLNGLGAAGAGAAGAAGAGSLGVDTAATVAGSGALSASTAGALGAGAAGTAAAGAAAFTVPELIVEAAATGLSIPAIAAAVGVPAATVAAVLSSGGGTPAVSEPTAQTTPTTTQPDAAPQATSPTPTVSPPVSPPPVAVDPGVTIDGLTVTPTASSGLGVGAIGAGVVGGGALLAGGGGGGGTPLPTQAITPDVVTAPQQPLSMGPYTTTPDALPPPKPPGLLDAIKSGDPKQIGDWIAANPAKAIELGLLSADALGTVAGGGTSSGGSGAFQPVKLPASFSATSPGFKLAGRGDARLMPPQDWNHYGEGPEQGFFTGITQPAALHNLSVQLDHAGGGGNGPHVRPAGRPPKAVYARGGHAQGAGDGRSDSIDAKLSDGEYVVDAETVALLGNGSNKAGADKLDQFRVNLRKAKGRNLAKGAFSVQAKDPTAYMAGDH